MLADRIGAVPELATRYKSLWIANLEVEVNRGASSRREGGGDRGPGPGMSYAKPLSRPGRNHDRSSRQLPRGTASYTNSPPQHRV